MRSRLRQDGGFTLVELLLSMSILGVILGVITTALMAFLANSEYTLQRDDHTGGASVAASYLDRDLASAETFASSGTACSGTPNALVLTWNEAKATVATPEPNPTAGGVFTAAYSVVTDASSQPVAGGQRYKLRRTYCVNGSSIDSQSLVVNLRAGDFFVDASASAACGPGTQRVSVALKPYLDDTTTRYSYHGCLKGRLG